MVTGCNPPDRVPGMTIPLEHGILVAFEGIDGAGKTTQANRLNAFLTHAGLDVVMTKEPTRGQYGARIRESARTGRLDAQEELRLFMLDRREHVDTELRPWLSAGRVVIIDRYYFSTVAYQGARGLNPEELLAANEQFAPQPDLLVILDVEPKIGLERVTGRGDVADLFENAAELQRARAIFASIRKPYLVHINGSMSPDEVELAIRERLLMGPLFDRLCKRPSRPPQCEPRDCPERIKGKCAWVRLGGIDQTAPGEAGHPSTGKS